MNPDLSLLDPGLIRETRELMDTSPGLQLAALLGTAIRRTLTGEEVVYGLTLLAEVRRLGEKAA